MLLKGVAKILGVTGTDVPLDDIDNLFKKSSVRIIIMSNNTVTVIVITIVILILSGFTFTNHGFVVVIEYHETCSFNVH